jgi:hypothetical protein
MGNRPNCGTRFLEEEVNAWIEERLASRERASPVVDGRGIQVRHKM